MDSTLKNVSSLAEVSSRKLREIYDALVGNLSHSGIIREISDMKERMNLIEAKIDAHNLLHEEEKQRRDAIRKGFWKTLDVKTWSIILILIAALVRTNACSTFTEKETSDARNTEVRRP